jgi:hypothetical protein
MKRAKPRPAKYPRVKNLGIFYCDNGARISGRAYAASPAQTVQSCRQILIPPEFLIIDKIASDMISRLVIHRGMTGDENHAI